MTCSELELGSAADLGGRRGFADTCPLRPSPSVVHLLLSVFVVGFSLARIFCVEVNCHPLDEFSVYDLLAMVSVLDDDGRWRQYFTDHPTALIRWSKLLWSVRQGALGRQRCRRSGLQQVVGSH